MILAGVAVAPNCIVCAGSVVTKSFPGSGIIIAGNPTRKIYTAEQLREKLAIHLEYMGTLFPEKTYLLENESRFKGYQE